MRVWVSNRKISAFNVSPDRDVEDKKYKEIEAWVGGL